MRATSGQERIAWLRGCFDCHEGSPALSKDRKGGAAILAQIFHCCRDNLAEMVLLIISVGLNPWHQTGAEILVRDAAILEKERGGQLETSVRFGNALNEKVRGVGQKNEFGRTFQKAMENFAFSPPLMLSSR